MRPLPAMQHKLPCQGLHHIFNLFKPPAERSGRKVHPMRRHFPDRALERLLKLELLQQHLHPEIHRQQSLGDQLGGVGWRADAPALGTLATGTITETHMTAADQTHLPADLLAFLPERKFGPDLAAARTDQLPGLQGVVDNLLRQIRAHLALRTCGSGLLSPASFGTARWPAGAKGRRDRLSGGRAAFGLAPKLLLSQPDQLPSEVPDLLQQVANENQELDDDFPGRLSALLEMLLALPRPRVLGAVIMRRLPITPPERGQLDRGDRRVLAGRNHLNRVTGGRKCVPHKMEENYGGGGIAEASRIRQVGLGRCYGIATVLLPWVSVGYPLGIPCAPVRTSVAQRCFHRAPGWF